MYYKMQEYLKTSIDIDYWGKTEWKSWLIAMNWLR